MKLERRFPPASILVGLALSLAAPDARSASCTWSTTSGNWNEIAKWMACVAGNGNPAGSPGSVDTAAIGSSGVVTINTAQSVLNLNNAGQINIDAFLLALAGGGSTINTGTINVGSGATAVLQIGAGHNITNTGGLISVANGSVVNQFGSTITGGTIATTGTGALVAGNSNSNFLSGVTLNGKLDLASGTGVERVTGGLTLNGAINVNLNSVLSFNGDQTLGGTGTVILGNTGGSNRALSLEGNTALTIGSGIVVRGENGTVGQAYLAGGTQSLINNGRISADVSGGTIRLAPGNGTTNNGILEAQNGGTLFLDTNVVGSVGGSIVAGAGSTVWQNGVALSGVINSAGTGSFRAANSNSNFLNGVTFNGPLDLASGTSVERVTGGLTLNGAINVNLNSVLSFNGDQTLGGTGTVILGNTGGSNRALGMEGNTALTIGSGIVVRGENGTVGQAYLAGGTQVLVNNGSILADVGGGLVDLSAGQTNNAATLGAANGGTLRLNNAVTNIGAGHIDAANGSNVIQNGVTVTGGMINSAGTGKFTASNSNSNFLSGVTLNGTLDLASGTGIERVTGGLTLANGGTVNVNSNSVLSFNGTQTLGGTGSIALGNTGASNRALSLEGNTTLTIGPNVVVHGVNGTIGQAYLAGGTQNLINNGTISSDGGGTIAVGVSGALTNNGTLQVNPGATMTVTAGITNFSGNTLTGGTYIVNGATGGTGTMQLSSLGNSVAGEIVNNAANITLDGPNANARLVDAGGNAALKPLASNSGSVTFSGGYAFSSVGNLANSGSVNIGSGSSLTVGPSATNNYNQSAGTTSVVGNLSAANVNINAGTLLGTGTVSGGTTIASGAELRPGTSATVPGTLSFTGSLGLNGTLDEVLNQSGFGTTSVIGSLTLSASSVLNLLQDPHYNPVAGTTFAIMTAGSPVTGAFGSILNQTFNAGTEMWNVLYNQGGNSVQLVAANVGAQVVAATWSTPSGNWTTATQWNCTPGPSTCVPNNDANFAYNAILNSPGATLTLDSTSSPTSLGVLSVLAQAGTLNIGTGSTLSVSGSVTNMNPATLQLSGGTLVVQGSLGNGGTITGSGTITGTGSLTNTFAVYADGGTLDLSGFAIANLSGGTLTGGLWQAGVNSAGTLKLPGDITTNSALIVVQNPNSQIIDGTGVNALAGLTSNQGGALTLFNGATFTTGGSFTNNNGSAINSSFGGSALTVNGNLANTNASLVNVNGNFGGASIAVLGNLVNDGTSSVQVQSGGALTVNGSFTSDGAVTHTSSAVTIGNNLVVGDGGGANATYAISGAGGTLNVGTGGLSVSTPFANSVVVGNGGNGVLTQSVGTTVTIGNGTNAASVAGTQVLNLGVNAGSSGTYTIGGAGSTLEVWGNSAPNNSAITVGSGGTGLFMQTGGAVIAHGANSLAIGDCCGGNGQYQISAGTLTTTGNAFVGAHSQGTILQTGGAVSVGGSLYVGYATNAVGQYTMNASAGNGAPSLQVAGSVSVGVNADATGAVATFNQSAGTTTIGGNLSLGVNAGGTGTMHVSGGSSISMTGPGATAVVGESGIGLLTLDGASTMTLASNGSMIVGLTSAASGTLIVTGTSSLNAGSLLGVGHNGTASTGASATVIVDDIGSSITATNVYVGSGGCLGGNGVIHGTVIMDGATASLNQCPQLHGPLPLAGNGLVNPNGILNPGRSPGRLVIDGGFDFIAGTIVLEVEVDPNAPGGYLFDELVFGPMCTLCVLDLLDMNIVFSFLGNTDPTAFESSGLWNLNTFFKTTTDPSGLGPDTDISTGLDATLAAIFGQSCTAQTPPGTPCATFTAESGAYDIQQFAFTTAGESGVETLVAPPSGGSTVPEPGTMMLVLMGGVLLLLGARRREPARRAMSG